MLRSPFIKFLVCGTVFPSVAGCPYCSSYQCSSWCSSHVGVLKQSSLIRRVRRHCVEDVVVWASDGPKNLLVLLDEVHKFGFFNASVCGHEPSPNELYVFYAMSLFGPHTMSMTSPNEVDSYTAVSRYMADRVDVTITWQNGTVHNCSISTPTLSGILVSNGALSPPAETARVGVVSHKCNVSPNNKSSWECVSSTQGGYNAKLSVPIASVTAEFASKVTRSKASIAMYDVALAILLASPCDSGEVLSTLTDCVLYPVRDYLGQEGIFVTDEHVIKVVRQGQEGHGMYVGTIVVTSLDGHTISYNNVPIMAMLEHSRKSPKEGSHTPKYIPPYRAPIAFLIAFLTTEEQR